MGQIMAEVIFTARDIDYLTSHFSESHLRNEVRSADNHIGVARCLGLDDELTYFEELLIENILVQYRYGFV